MACNGPALLQETPAQNSLFTSIKDRVCARWSKSSASFSVFFLWLSWCVIVGIGEDCCLASFGVVLFWRWLRDTKTHALLSAGYKRGKTVYLLFNCRIFWQLDGQNRTVKTGRDSSGRLGPSVYQHHLNASHLLHGQSQEQLSIRSIFLAHAAITFSIIWSQYRDPIPILGLRGGIAGWWDIWVAEHCCDWKSHGCQPQVSLSIFSH